MYCLSPSAWPEEPRCWCQPWWREVPGSDRLEGRFQNGSCQHQGPLSRMSSPKLLLPASPSYRGSPSCFLPLWKALQDQRVGLTQGPFKLLPLRWDLEHVRFCVHPLRVESFLQPFNSPHMQAPLAFKAIRSGGLSPWCRTNVRGKHD